MKLLFLSLCLPLLMFSQAITFIPTPIPGDPLRVPYPGTFGSGAPSNPCPKAGAQYIDTVGLQQWDCPAAGGNWFLTGTGSAGPAGAGYTATSTSSLTIGTGSKTFTTQSGLAYVAGNTVQATYASNSADYMFGTITSYSGTTMVVNVTAVGGSGTFASWNISLQGLPGQVGSSASATLTGTGSSATLDDHT